MSYDLKPVETPKLKGLALRVVTTLMESALFRPLLLPGLLKKAGVTAFRKKVVEAPPVTHPMVAPAEPEAAAGIWIWTLLSRWMVLLGLPGSGFHQSRILPGRIEREVFLRRKLGAEL